MVGDDKVAPGRCLAFLFTRESESCARNWGPCISTSIQPLALFLTSESCRDWEGGERMGFFQAEI